MSELNEPSNALEKTCDIDSPDLVILDRMMSSGGNSNRFDNSVNKNVTFNKDCTIPKEDFVALNPESF